MYFLRLFHSLQQQWYNFVLISIVNHCTFDYVFKTWFETQQFSALFVHQSVVCQKVFITTAMTMETFDTGHES